MDPVTQALQRRVPSGTGMEGMLFVSLVVHAAVITGLAVAAPLWRGAEPATREVMTISLGGGTAGPDIGGMTPIAARPVQRVVEAPPRQALRAPSARPPDMTIPAPDARPVPRRPPVETDGPARSRTPTTGEQVQAGTAVGETTGRGQGFGLSSGGGQGTATATLDVGNFCCPDYLLIMQARIRENWDFRQRDRGQVVVKMTIVRDGRLTNIELERSSGHVTLDLASQRALALTRQLPELPRAFPDDQLTVHLTFQY